MFFLLATSSGSWAYHFLVCEVRYSCNATRTQIVLLFLLPFASYLIAEHIGVSGILAAVAAGMTITRSGVMR
ncbi:cation:proton antiporter, partial [Salmonella enterica subsp. enterica serovar Virginia]|nr:cation:proton antiporter [Salmonella enterica subsp. enterica serovar Virginia]